jgi:F-type H+-transporting ATPase subunit epsilon
MPLKVEIVTPEKKVFSDEVEKIRIPGMEGEFQMIASHTPLVTIITPGELTLTKKDGAEESLAIGEGFIETTLGNVSIVVDVALGESEIDENAVEEALKRAQDALADTSEDDENFAALQALIVRSSAQLEFKRRRRP